MAAAASVDVARVRGLYPTLAAGTAQLEGPFAALQPESVIRAIIATLRSAPAQPGSRSARSQQSAARVDRTRRAVADLVAGRPEDVVLGHSTVALLQRFIALLAVDWQLGDEVVLNRLDADLVALPFQRAARNRGTVVKWAEVDLDTGAVPAWQYDELVGRHTRIVTIALGNPATGAISDVTAVAERAHEQGALVVVDAGAAPAYVPIDLAQLGADLLLVSAPVFGGPTVAAAVARPGLLSEINELEDGPRGPEHYEVPPLPIELLEGLVAAVDHLAELAEGGSGTRRERIRTSLDAAGRHTAPLYARLDAGLRSLDGVTVLGGADRQLPVAAFTVDGRRPVEVGTALQRHRVAVWTGPSGVGETMHAFGADDVGGASFVGLMPHSTAGEVDQFLEAIGTLTGA